MFLEHNVLALLRCLLCPNVTMLRSLRLNKIAGNCLETYGGQGQHRGPVHNITFSALNII